VSSASPSDAAYKHVFRSVERGEVGVDFVV
jgi:hypothetical protein